MVHGRETQEARTHEMTRSGRMTPLAAAALAGMMTLTALPAQAATLPAAIDPEAHVGGTSSETRQAERQRIQRLIVMIALENGTVPAELALAVGRVESNFRATAESPVGARGVMQIMPRTAMGEFGVAKDDLWDAETNIRLGVRFLERLYLQYGKRWDAALSHYNGGTLRGDPRVAPPHGYTAGYVRDVLAWQQRFISEQRVAMIDAPGSRPARPAATPQPTEAHAKDAAPDPDVPVLEEIPGKSRGSAPQYVPGRRFARETCGCSQPDVQDDVPVVNERRPGKAARLVEASEDLGRRFRASLSRHWLSTTEVRPATEFRGYGYRHTGR